MGYVSKIMEAFCVGGHFIQSMEDGARTMTKPSKFSRPMLKRIHHLVDPMQVKIDVMMDYGNM